MDAIALAWSDVPAELIQQHGLDAIAHDRGGEAELWFERRSRRPMLPVWHEGQLLIVPWGRKGGGLTWQTTVDAGQWIGADPVEIRAAGGMENGFWYRIHQGIRGLLACGEAYVLVEPSSYYYRVMTRSDRMPVLIGERI